MYVQSLSPTRESAIGVLVFVGERSLSSGAHYGTWCCFCVKLSGAQVAITHSNALVMMRCGKHDCVDFDRLRHIVRACVFDGMMVSPVDTKDTFLVWQVAVGEFTQAET